MQQHQIIKYQYLQAKEDQKVVHSAVGGGIFTETTNNPEETEFMGVIK